MDIFFTSDTHFGHSKVIEYEDRPFADADEMDRLLIQNWNQKVQPGDLVYHLGDVSFHKKEKTRELLKKLNGIKICIRGNHDFRPTAMMNLGFTACLEACYMCVGRHDCYVGHEPLPMSAPNTWMLHGHVHSKWKVLPFDRKICLSVENWAYSPVSETELISIMDKATNPWGREERDEEEESSEEESQNSEREVDPRRQGIPAEEACWKQQRW
jgi:calcineurin-like phosphoesterase family protein